MGKYINQVDLENALSAPTVKKIFTDPLSTTLNTAAIADVIDRAEGEVDSFLITVIDINSPNLNRFDRLLRQAAIDFAKVFAFERHPEYEKTVGEDPRGSSLYKRAKDRMERIQSAVQELPDQPAVRPTNTGAVIHATGPRMMIDGLDGTRNGDGF
jgi:hypothetical protein